MSTRARDNFYSKYYNRFRAAGFLELLFSPLTALVTNPVNLVRSLSNTLYGLKGEWTYYSGFSSSPAFLKLFYHVQSLELARRGRKGTSPVLGFGHHPMKRFWYQSVLAIALQRALGGAVLSSLGMGVWAATHLLWLDRLAFGFPFALVTILAAVCSTNFYGNLFTRQNYNVVAWAFLPLALLALFNGELLLLTITAFAIAVFSLTVFLFLCGTVMVAVLFSWSPNGFSTFPFPFLPTLLPGLIYVVLSMKSVLFEDGFASGFSVLKNLLGVLGGGKKTVRLARPPRWAYAFAFSAVWATFPLGVWFWHPGFGTWKAPTLTAVAALPVLWFFVNQSRLFRLADAHSLLLLFLTVSAAITLTSHSTPLLVLFWLLNSNPLIAFQLYQFDVPTEKVLIAPPVVKPFTVKPYLDAVAELVSMVPAGEKLLLPFEDPQGSYNALFDGYSDIYQLLLHHTVERQIHAFPDWYCVEQLNVGGHRPVWGRSPQAVANNLRSWNARYALVYVKEDDVPLDFIEAGLQEVATLDWRQFQETLTGSPLFASGWVEWKVFKLI